MEQLAALKVEQPLPAQRLTSAAPPSVLIWQVHRTTPSQDLHFMPFAVPWTRTASSTPSSCRVRQAWVLMTTPE